MSLIGNRANRPELVFSCATPTIQLQPTDAWALCESLGTRQGDGVCAGLYAERVGVDATELMERGRHLAAANAITPNFAQSVVDAISAYQVQCEG